MRVLGAGLGKYRAPVGGFVGGQPEVHVGGCVQTDAGVTMLVVVQWVKVSMNCLASQSDPKRSGNAGPYFNVLNSDSEYGLSLDTRVAVERTSPVKVAACLVDTPCPVSMAKVSVSASCAARRSPLPRRVTPRERVLFP